MIRGVWLPVAREEEPFGSTMMLYDRLGHARSKVGVRSKSAVRVVACTRQIFGRRATLVTPHSTMRTPPTNAVIALVLALGSATATASVETLAVGAAAGAAAFGLSGLRVVTTGNVLTFGPNLVLPTKPRSNHGLTH